MVARDAIASSSGRNNHLSFLVGAIDLCSLPYLEPMSADDKMRSSAPRLLLRKCSGKRTLHYRPFEDRVRVALGLCRRFNAECHASGTFGQETRRPTWCARLLRLHNPGEYLRRLP